MRRTLRFLLIVTLAGTHVSHAQAPGVVAEPGSLPRWRDAPAYEARHAGNVLRRSVYFMPMFGAVYPEKFEALLSKLPPTRLRGVVVYNHGCGGQWGWETSVSQFFYRAGFAVVAPEFVSREGNKLGCPGANEEEARRASSQREREGVYQATNPARLAARATDVMAMVDWLKSRTRLPILVAGHSEGCRTVYSLHLRDPQVVGGICVKQGLQSTFEHTWRWNTQVPLWQSLEEFDPWVVFPPGTTVRDVTFERKFRDAPDRLTVVLVPGKTHNPLNHEDERQSLGAWLDRLVPKPAGFRLDGVDYEALLPDLQDRLKSR